MYGAAYYGPGYWGSAYFGTAMADPLEEIVATAWFVVPRSVTQWVLEPRRMSTVAPEILVKHPSEVRVCLVAFDEKLSAGDTLTSAAVSIGSGTDTSLMWTTPAVNESPAEVYGRSRPAGTVISFAASGGQEDSRYRLLVSGQTSGGETLAGVIRVLVVSQEDA